MLLLNSWLGRLAQDCISLQIDLARKRGGPPWAVTGFLDNYRLIEAREKKVCVTLEGGMEDLGNSKSTVVGGR